jgi:hypothetical protein
MPNIQSANLVTRAVFKEHVEDLRRVHSVERDHAYRWMKECGCNKCDGFGNGRPSTLHDYSRVRLLATHPLEYLNHKINELGANGFDSEELRDRYLKRVISEHMDIVYANLDHADDSKQLEEVEQLQSVLSDYAAKLRGEIANQQRAKSVEKSVTPLRAAK